MSRDPLIFPGTVDADGCVHLVDKALQRATCKRELAGQEVDVAISPIGSAKTRSQEQGFHAMIAPWAKSEGIRIDDLKRDCLRYVFGEMEHVDRITGVITMVLREPHTSTLKRAQYIELIDRTLEQAAECGVYLEAPSEYRERKAKELKKLAEAQ